MADIVLATLNARYIHTAVGLRYLFANLGDLQDRTTLLEFTIQHPTLEILEAILSQQPKIVGFGVYIWNVTETTRLLSDLKRIRPDIIVVLGGPEVSYELDDQEIVKLADCVITGEADLEFARFCRTQLATTEQSNQNTRSTGLSLTGDSRFLSAPIPILDQVTLPYDLYTDEDIAHRVIYVEASRGCPFTCEFCLSALEIPVRQFPLEAFLDSIESLLQRGVRQFKFVDRTFNLNLRVSKAILEFFLDHYRPGLFLHFEMIPDRLPESLRTLIAKFPAGVLQFEVGIQTFNETVCDLISRHQDNQLVEQNLRWLRESTGVHVHADLIVGLPGESIESFAAGFDRLVQLAPHEIQVGILKRLRGTPIIRHDAEWQMVYSPHPPYEILSTKLLDFFAVQELRRFAKYWDTIANSGNFVETLPLVWTDWLRPESEVSPFSEFRLLVSWLYQEEQKLHGIALGRMVELMFLYLTQKRNLPAKEVAARLWRDYQRGGRSDKPHCLRPYIEQADSDLRIQTAREVVAPRRQARHMNL